jgi:DNA-nicking Smr family endonuclease
MTRSRSRAADKPASSSPFSQLDIFLENAGVHLKKTRETTKEAQSAPVPQTDEELFLEAMEGVTHVSWRHEPLPSPTPPPHLPGNQQMEDLRLMQTALESDSELTLSDHPEYIEGWIGVSGKRFLPSLRTGLYSIQGQIDLHGLTRAEARTVVEEFVARMCRFGPSCVKIVHGRGMNSPDERAILKESLQRWLSTRRMARHVVAYASAPQKDGGLGAIYLLLRSRSKG